MLDTALTDLLKKLQKSQSIDTVDMRAEETIKMIARHPSHSF